MMQDDSFREAMNDVTPLDQKRARKRVAPDPAASPSPTIAQQERRDAALGLRASASIDPNPLTLGEVKGVQPRDTLSWKKDGVQREVFRKLRAGKYPVDGTLDLHRHTVREAREALFRFIGVARDKGWRTLLISHGRGEQSPTPARIKSYVAHWLTEIPEVIAFHSAAAHQGGTGAVYAMMRKTPEAREEARERYGFRGSDDDPAQPQR